MLSVWILTLFRSLVCFYSFTCPPFVHSGTSVELRQCIVSFINPMMFTFLFPSYCSCINEGWFPKSISNHKADTYSFLTWSSQLWVDGVCMSYMWVLLWWKLLSWMVDLLHDSFSSSCLVFFSHAAFRTLSLLCILLKLYPRGTSALRTLLHGTEGIFF